MQANAIIILQGDFKNSGIGFSSLKQAILMDILGEFFYINENQVEIRIIGSQQSLDAYYQWCLQLPTVNEGNLFPISKHEIEYTEFKITNQL